MSSDSRKILSSGTSWSCAQKTQMENPHQPSHLQPLGPTHQQHAHSHHGRSARGHGAVHQDHVVVTNVLGQPQVVELGAATGSGLALTHGTSGSRPCALRRPPRTSGSPVSWLVWMRMVPMRTSLHTARSAGSMVSPARRMDTPVIWGGAVWAVRTRPAGPPRPGPAPAPAPPPASLRSHHGLIDGVGGFVRENAGRQAGDHLAGSHLEGRMQDVVVDVHVFPLGGTGVSDGFRPSRQDPSPYRLPQQKRDIPWPSDLGSI